MSRLSEYRLQPMVNAPQDRWIFIRIKRELVDDPPCIVAKYASWDREGPYKEVWEMGPGECYRIDDPQLEGWMDIPEAMNSMKTQET